MNRNGHATLYIVNVPRQAREPSFGYTREPTKTNASSLVEE